MSTTNVFEAVKTGRMSGMQWRAVIVGLLLIVLDGYDIALASFASPYIAQGLRLTPQELGYVGSGALVGMCIGAGLIAPLGDKYGRRFSAILGSVLATAGMAVSASADVFEVLIVGRVITGAGVGTLLAAIAVIFSEYVNRKFYALVMGLYAAGVPLGTLFGSQLAGPVIAEHGWRAGFLIGLFATGACIPLTLWAIPESLSFVAGSRKPGALKRFNKLLTSMRMPAVDALPDTSSLAKPKVPVSEVFRGSMLVRTLMAIVSYFLFMAAFYFTTHWSAKYLADVTGDHSIAPHLMTMYSVGGLIGVAVFAVVTARAANLYLITAGVLLVSALGMGLYGMAATAQTLPVLTLSVASVFLSAGTAGFYAVVPRLYPEKIRSTGYGIVIGVGRIGGVVGPSLGGFFFQRNVDERLVYWLFAIPMVLSAVMLVAMRGLRDGQDLADEEAGATMAGGARRAEEPEKPTALV
ncbi:MFS transporter [Nocardioides sp. J54]|uniref:MFS transporter n=1 Tax=Nocardioides sp. J54 TaxID=935866 RepID=UPI0004B6DC47|nr:MFS transporter [Nocardioides sp. J54]